MNKKLLIWNMLLAVLIVVSVKRSSAQKKEVKEEKLEITINNGDTTVNGKKFKNITEQERAELRKKFSAMPGKIRITTDPAGFDRKEIRIIGNGDRVITGLDSGKVRFYSFDGDGQGMNFEFKMDSLRKNMRFLSGDSARREVFIKRFGDGADIDWEMVHPGIYNGKRMEAPRISNMNRGGMNSISISRPNTPNTSHFDYTTTDKDGFTTELHLNVMDPSKANLELLKKSKEAINSLEIKNLVFYPNFTTGKTTISFQAPAKTSLEVKLLDNQGEVITSEKKTLTTDVYTKDLSLIKNGIYYLEITQGSKSFIKKIVKN